MRRVDLADQSVLSRFRGLLTGHVVAPSASFRGGGLRLLLCTALLVGRPSRVGAQGSGDRRPAGGEIHGRLAEAVSGMALTAGSITVRRSADGSLAGGARPDPDGAFRVHGLELGRYTVHFRAIGFAPLVRADIALSAEHPKVDLGTLRIASVAVQLETQTVNAERADVAFAPDRNSYAVRNMTTASGGTAVDVLRNVPSIEVDGSNKVSLRGNENVVVQINGRASPLRGEQLGTFLSQIPASAVSHVEVATNPSAKNDPEGTAGLVNIVLTQQAELGLSGGLTAGTGTTGLANISGNVGRQAGPWTFLTTYSLYSDSRALSGSSARDNLTIGAPTFVNGRIAGSVKPLFQTMTLRSEYKLSEHDILAADGVVSVGRFARDNATSYVDLDSSGAVIGRFNQFGNATSRNANQDYTVAFRRTGDAAASTFSTELRFLRNSWASENLLSSAVLQADPSTTYASFPTERDVTAARLPSWVVQSDYTHPFAGGTKLESGVKATTRTTSNDFTAAYRDSTGAFALFPSRTAAFDYREQIGAVYAVVSQPVGPLVGQAGLRLEEATTRFTIPPTPAPYRSQYGSAFPSAILSYNATELRQLKASYSRRISRPDPFQLSPVERRDDPRNVFRGNPFLRPEYTDAFEVGLQEARQWGSLQLTPYFRTTAHAVRFIRSVDTTGVTVSTFANVASTAAVGADLNVTYRVGGLNIFGGGGAYRYRSDAGNLPGNLSTRTFGWNTRANVSWKLSSLTDAQLFANYRAPMETEGGSQHAFVFMNVALRRKLFGESGSVTLRVQDPFNVSAFGFDTRDGRVIESTERRFGMRGIFVTFTRTFGRQLTLKPRTPEQDPVPQAGPPVTAP